MGSGNLTTGTEVAAYLAAHLFGSIALYLLNPIILGALLAGGYQASVPAVALSISLLMMLAVMLLFFIARKALAGVD